MKNLSKSYLVDEQYALHLLTDFIKLQTINPPGNEKMGAEFLAQHLEQFGLQPQIIDLGEGRANVTAVYKGTGEAPALIYNGHIDVVPPGDTPWTYPPFAGQIVDGKLYGRGSSDMKGGVTAMVMAIGTLARQKVPLKGDLLFAAVADEEVRGAGAQRFVEEGGVEEASAVVISEPTNFEVYIAEKGTCWIELRTTGKTAHGAMPHLGVNAIVHMHAVLTEILQMQLPHTPHPLLGRPTLNIGTIAGGVKTNVVPDQCTISIDIRTLPDMSTESIVQEIQRAIEQAKQRIDQLDVSLHLNPGRPAVETSPDTRIVQTALQLSADLFGRKVEARATPGYATDASVFCYNRPLPFVICGPGRAELAHQPDEYIEVADYLKSIPFYCALAERYLNEA